MLLGIINYKQFFSDSSKIYWKNLKTNGQFFKLQSISILAIRGPRITYTSFCAVVRVLLTNLNHYFNDSVDINMIFSIRSNMTSDWVTLPLKDSVRLPGCYVDRYNEGLADQVSLLTEFIVCILDSFNPVLSDTEVVAMTTGQTSGT